MRVLVACGACKRQYDASGLGVGRRFRCACGEVLRVPDVEARDAAVVRCSSCGGPRGATESTCRFCNTAFTVHEQDMATICASCMTRVSDSARYCHHCGKPVVPEGGAGTRTDHRCPACEGRHRLSSRELGREAVSVLECSYCGGLWIGNESFELMLDRARETAAADPQRATSRTSPDPPRSGPPPGEVLYRKCPVCEAMMNRRNFGKRSGVVVDTCREHGHWFDAHELDRILRWIRQGGEESVRRRADDEARHRERLKRYERELPGSEPTTRRPGFERSTGDGFLEGLIRAMFDA